MTTPAKIGRPRNSDEPEHVYLLKMPKAIWNAAAAKAKVINGYLGWMKQSMNQIGSINGVDLTGLTDFGTVKA